MNFFTIERVQSMQSKFFKMMAVLALVVFSVGVVNAETLLIDFENVPPVPQGPSVFSSAGPAQTLDVDGKATVSNGVVLGYPTNLPATPYATSPNLYGTAHFADASLTPNITIDFDPTFEVHKLEGLLFNGWTQTVDYTVTAYDEDDNVIDTDFFDDMPSNYDGGYGEFSLDAVEAIAKVVFSPDNDTNWDYFIDSITVNATLQDIFDVPTPAAAGMGFVLLAGIMLRSRRSIA